jgi:hypothetical protein
MPTTFHPFYPGSQPQESFGKVFGFVSLERFEKITS